MNRLDFTQVIPRLKVLETKLLDKTKIDRMIDSKDPEEALKVLGETEYAAYMTNIKRAADYEVLLSEELKRTYKMLYSIIPSKDLVDVMALKYDYHNIKVFIKEKLLGKDFSNMLIPIGIMELDKLKYAITSEDFRDLTLSMRNAIETALSDFQNFKDPQRIDIIIDGYMFEELKVIDKNIKDKALEKFIKSTIDLTNLKSLFRVKKQNKSKEFLNSVVISGGYLDKDRITALFSDTVENIVSKLAYTDYSDVLKNGFDNYIKDGSLNNFEKLSDNYIMNFMKNAKLISFGIEPILAYIYAKENELKLIRIIMVGKLNNIAGEVIKERLRENYV